MKKLVIFLFFLSNTGYLISQPLANGWYSDRSDMFVQITDRNMFIEYVLSPERNMEGGYTISERFSVPFMQFCGEEYLCLYSNQLLYFERTGSEYFFGGNFAKGGTDNLGSSITVTASSFLIEGSRKYVPENVSIAQSGNPWVEGASGNGIGEWLAFEDEGELSGIIISIGYVSIRRPELYEWNARPKRIRIIGGNDIFSIEVTLMDTPNYQAIRFPLPVRKYKLIIEDVYPGTKWDDLCVNNVLRIPKAAAKMFDYIN